MTEVVFCLRCFMPSSRPRMTVDASGVCSACRVAESRAGMDVYEDRQISLRQILAASRTTGPYDCVVAWSGGKDSSAIALRLKEELHLNPLLVTFSPLIPTPEGEANRSLLLNMGFDSIMVRPNQKVSRDLSRRFFIERGDPKVHWNAGVNAAPMRMALALRIPIVFYAEHGESEYGGRLLSSKHQMERDLVEVLEHQIGDDPANWADSRTSESDLFPYRYPDVDELSLVGVRALYFAYFFPWDVTENHKFVTERFPFEGNRRGRTYGTFTDYDSVDDVMDDLYYYMQFIKFGFGRCLRDAARMIQRGHLSRSEGFELIRQFDGEFPQETLEQCLDYMRVSRSEFEEVVNRHRSPRIWSRARDGWQLKHEPTL